MSDTYIYVIGAIGHRPVKIGKANEVQERLRTLQTGSPYPLELRLAIKASADLEYELHRRFKPFRQHSEWFDFGDKDAVAEVLTAIGDLRKPTGELDGQREDRRSIWERIDGYLDEPPYLMPRYFMADDGLRLDRIGQGEGTSCFRCAAGLPQTDGLAFAFVDDDDRPACDSCATHGRPERTAMLRVLRDCERTLHGLSNEIYHQELLEFLRAMHWGARAMWGEFNGEY